MSGASSTSSERVVSRRRARRRAPVASGAHWTRRLALVTPGSTSCASPNLAIDNATPFMTGDMVGGETQKAAGKNIVALSLPPEVAAKNAARLVDETKQLPKNAKIGILAIDIPAQARGRDAREGAEQARLQRREQGERRRARG